MTIAYQPLVISKGYRFACNFAQYPSGNLQANFPWTYRFPGGGCNQLIGFLANSRFEEQGDTVNGHWTAIDLSNAPLRRNWIVQATFGGFVNTNAGRWNFGCLSYMDSSKTTMGHCFGFSVRRVTNGGAVTNNSGGTTIAGAACGGSELVFPDGTIANGDVLRMETRQSGNNYDVDYYKNGVFQATRNHSGGAGNVGCVPAMWNLTPGGTAGIAFFNTFSAREIGSVNTVAQYRI